MTVFAIGPFVPETMVGRVSGAVLIAVLVLGSVWLANRTMDVSFANGYMVAVGVFASFDLLVVHWLMELHRITEGPEAIWIEVLLFLTGVAFVVGGLRREFRARRGSDAVAG